LIKHENVFDIQYLTQICHWQERSNLTLFTEMKDCFVPRNDALMEVPDNFIYTVTLNVLLAAKIPDVKVLQDKER